MRYKLLGWTGLRVSELCLGTMTFGEEKKSFVGAGTSEETARQMYSSFRDHGGNFVDTANEMYTDGHAEEIVGRLVAGHRADVVIATKYTLALKGNRNPNAIGNHRKSLVQSVEGSLKRLGTDYIDLLWVHSWDDMTPVEEMMRALDDMVRAGKVLYVGASNLPSWITAQCNTLADCRDWTAFAAQQIEYSLIERSAEHALLPMARHMHLTTLAWSPLKMGILSGKFVKGPLDEVDSKRFNSTLLTDFLNERNLVIARAVDDMARSLGRSSSQVALNWLRAKEAVIPLLGARTIEQWQDNIGCLEFSLTHEQVKHLDEISKPSLSYQSANFMWLAENRIQPGVQTLVDRH